MDARTWASAKHLLADVVDLPPAEQRAYIEAHCSDAALRRELLAMLDAPAVLSNVAAAAMALAPGTRFGPYEIVELIGAGGMGEVYRAHDSRLDRLVAVKVLRPEIAAESAAGSRFDREARIIAGLNHPRICTLHDVGDHQGIRYLVMEFVEGETLADRLARGSLSITQLTEYAIQIADALEFAHSKGFVHRDLKPANIMITKSGAKLLDFGIAKLRPGLAADSSTVELTSQGTLVGTLAYMAPEQLQGEQVDPRTDVWAFGAVLYELVTRKRAFRGDSAAVTMAAILEREPTPITTERPDAPALVPRIISRCLVKDPDRRWQSITDVRAALEWVGEGLGAAAPPPVPSRARAGLAWSVAAVGLIASAYMIFQSVAGRHEAVDEERVQIAAPATSDPYSLAISPDGRSLVFSVPEGQTSRLWLWSLGAGAARPIDGTDKASSPFWKPDGTSIGFFADGQLKLLDLSSGVVRSLVRAAAWRGGSWGADDIIIYAPGSLEPLLRIPATGGEPVAATRLGSRFLGHRSPHFLPDGRHFLFYANAGGVGSSGVYVSGPDMEPKWLLQADSDAIPVDTGHLLFVANDTLFEQAFDPVRLEIRGSRVPVAKSVASDQGLAAVTASRSGAIAFRTGGPRKRQLQWLDRQGKALGLVGILDPNAMLNPDLSNDDAQVVLQRFTPEGWNLWTVDTARGGPVRLTDDTTYKWCAIWSPDRRRIAFASNRRGAFDLYETDASGRTGERLLLASATPFKIPMDWSRDGKMLLYRTADQKTGSDLWALPLEGDAKPFPVANTRFEEREGQFSPDGHWVAYQSDETGRFEIYLQPFPDGGEKKPVSLNGGAQVRWNPADGGELFYIALDGTLMAVRVTLDSGRPPNVGEAVELFQTNISLGAIPGANKQQYMVGASGQRFLISITPSDLTNSPIDVILHWKPPSRH